MSTSATLSGTVRYSDGVPAPGVRVLAVPSSSAPASAQTAFAIPYSPTGLTGATGEYRIPAQADTYYIVAGFAEASSFHTGDPAATTPKSVTVTASARIDNLDVQISRPPLPLKGTTVRGLVRTADGNPVFDSTVLIARPLTSSGPVGVSLPSAYAVPETRTAVDGTFEFTDVVPGFYNARVSSGPVHRYQSLEVASGPAADLEFTLPLVNLSGRIVWENGTPVTDPAVLSELGLTIKGSSILNPKMLSISTGGTFAIALGEGDYQLVSRSVPAYEIRSMRVDDVDLQNGKLRIDGKTSRVAEVRIGARSKDGVRDLAKVTGSVASAIRPQYITLCCAGASTFFASVRPDGSFEFQGVPAGNYEVEVTAGAVLNIERATVIPTSDGAQLVVVAVPGVRGVPAKIEVPKRY